MNHLCRFALLPLLLIFLTTACTPVADPHKGGLFGYSPELYEQRIEEREARLSQIKNEGQAEQAKSAALQQDISRTSSELENLKKEMDAINIELMQTRAALKKTEVKSVEAKNKQAQLEAQLQELGRTSWKTGKQLDQGNVAAKEKEVAALRERLNTLMEEMELLGQL